MALLPAHCFLEVTCVAGPPCLAPFAQAALLVCRRLEPCRASFIHLWEPSHLLRRFFQLLWPVPCQGQGATGRLLSKDNGHSGSPPGGSSCSLALQQALTSLALPPLPPQIASPPRAGGRWGPRGLGLLLITCLVVLGLDRVILLPPFHCSKSFPRRRVENAGLWDHRPEFAAGTCPIAMTLGTHGLS